MERLTIIGKYPDKAYQLLNKRLGDKFNISYIFTQEELDKASDLEYVILRTLKIDKTIIMNNSNLRLIQRWGAGFDTVDIETAGRRNIPVAVAAGVNSFAVAEHTILLILALYRHLIPLNKKTKMGVWDRTTYASNSYTISGKKVGLLGCGFIGRTVAEKLMALGAEVQYYDLYRLGEKSEKELGIQFTDFETLLKTSDIISLHLPLTSDTAGLITRKEFQLMKKNAILINTSRGGIINEDDLADALESGAILGAGLDSFKSEPYPKEGRLNSIDNVIMTPHIGGTVSDLVIPMVEKVSENIIRVKENKSLNKRDYVNYKYCSYPVE